MPENNSTNSTENELSGGVQDIFGFDDDDLDYEDPVSEIYGFGSDQKDDDEDEEVEKDVLEIDKDDDKKVDAVEGSEEDKENNVNDVVKDEEESSKTEFEPVKFSFDGQEIEIDNLDDLKNLAEKGLKSNETITKLKPYLDNIELLDNAGLSVKDLKAIADAKAGNKAAQKYVNENLFGIKEDDVYSPVEEEPNEYNPEVKKTDPITEIFEDIKSKDAELAGKIYNKVDTEIDPELRSVILSDPRAFNAFTNEIKNGTFDEKYAEVKKVKALNPTMHIIEAFAYVEEKLNKKEEPKKENNPDKDIQIKQSGNSNHSTKTEDENSIWDNDEEFNKMYEEIFGKKI